MMMMTIRMILELLITMHATNPADGLPNPTDSTVNPPGTHDVDLAPNRKIYQLPGPASVTPHGDKIQSGKDQVTVRMGILRAWTRLEVVTLAVNGHHLQRGVPRLASSLILPVLLCAGEPAMEKRALGSSPASCVPDYYFKGPVPMRLGVGMKTEPQWALSFSSWPSPDQDADLVTSHSSHNYY